MTFDPISIHNERTKLVASSINALGIGLIGFSLLRPITDDLTSLDSAAAWWVLVGFVLHLISHYILGDVRKDGS